jgi:hypothetical protein
MRRVRTDITGEKGLSGECQLSLDMPDRVCEICFGCAARLWAKDQRIAISKGPAGKPDPSNNVHTGLSAQQ